MPEERGKIKWYHRPSVVIIALLAIGPFALPLVWSSPAFTRWSKIVITVLILALTVWLIKASADLYQALLKHLRELQNAYSN